MKTTIRSIFLWAACAAVLPAISSAANLDISNAAYYWSGSSRYLSTASQSVQYRYGLGAGYYSYGSLGGTITNRSGWRSGSVVGNLWVTRYIGASTGWVTFSAGWGNNWSNVFYAYQRWYYVKFGYRKRINAYGYATLYAQEYTGYSWPARDKLVFYRSYQRW